MIRLRVLSVFADFLLLVCGFTLAYFLRVGFIFSTDFRFEPYFWTAVVTSFIWIFFFFVFRVYRLQGRWHRWQHYMTVWTAGLAGIAVFGLFFYLFYRLQFSRLLLLYAYLLGSILVSLSHVIFEMIHRGMVKRGKGIRRVLVLGSNRTAEQLIRTLIDRHSFYVPVAVLDGYGTSQADVGGVPVLGKLDKLENTVDELAIDEIIQVDNLEQTINIINFCSQRNIGYAMLPTLLGVYRDHSREMMEGQSVIRVRDQGMIWYELLFGL